MSAEGPVGVARPGPAPPRGPERRRGTGPAVSCGAGVAAPPSPRGGRRGGAGGGRSAAGSAPPTLAGGAARWPRPLARAGSRGAGGGVVLGAVAPAPPAGEGRRGRPGSRSVPARSEAPQTPTRTTSQHVGKEDCHLRRHRQDRAHHAGAGGASRHELGRAGGRCLGAHGQSARKGHRGSGRGWGGPSVPWGVRTQRAPC